MFNFTGPTKTGTVFRVDAEQVAALHRAAQADGVPSAHTESTFVFGSAVAELEPNCEIRVGSGASAFSAARSKVIGTLRPTRLRRAWAIVRETFTDRGNATAPRIEALVAQWGKGDLDFSNQMRLINEGPSKRAPI